MSISEPPSSSRTLATAATLEPRATLVKRPPPSMSDKVRRGLWGMVYVLFFCTTPTPLHAWRRLLLRAFGAKIGSRVGVYPTAQIWAPWNLKIAEGATIGGGANLYTVDSIVIGKSAVVSQGAHLCTASHDHNSEGFELITAPIEVAENAWVCAEAFIGPGVSLGEGAVVSARAVVVRSVAARQIVVGNPARAVSERAAAARNILVGRVEPNTEQ